MQIEIDPADVRLLVVLLDIASDEFCNHGCNDFNLVRDGGLSSQEVPGVVARARLDLPGDEISDGAAQSDCFLYARFRVLFQRALAAAELSEDSNANVTQR